MYLRTQNHVQAAEGKVTKRLGEGQFAGLCSCCSGELGVGISESYWRMRPPIRFQGNRLICWAEAISSWSMVTAGVPKFRTGRDVIDFAMPLGVVNHDESIQLPVGMEKIGQALNLKFTKFEGGGSLSAINIVPLLKRSHLIVVFRRPSAQLFHFVVVYGVDRFHICFMDPEINPNGPRLDSVRKNRVCARIDEFGAGAREFFVFWKGS